MALTDEEKLQNLEAEAVSDAKKISGEIQENTKREFEEKVEDGEKKLLADIYAYIQNEINQIRREKNLEISRVNIETQHEYFRYGDAAPERVFENVRQRLKTFTESKDYETYLLESCRNVIQKSGSELDIMYMPKDEKIINNIKNQIQSSNNINNININNINFKADAGITLGGLKFFNKSKNIMVNDAFDEKMQRAKELLSSLMGPQFTAI